MAHDAKKPLSPAVMTLIEELAKRVASDYLTGKSAPERRQPDGGSNRVGLPDLNKAA